MKAFEELNVTADRGGRSTLREPAQRGGGIAPAEGREDHRVAPAPDVGPLVRRRGGHHLRFALRLPRVVREGGAAGAAHHAPDEEPEGGPHLPPALGEEAAFPRLGDRRRRDQGRRREAPATARRDEPRPAVGDRLQVPAGGADGAVEVDRGPHRPHREDHAVRGPGAGVRGWRHDHERHAAQRGRDPAQGRPQGRHRDRPPSRRRDPGDRRAGPGETAEERPEVEDAQELPLVRHPAGAPRGRGRLAMPQQGRLPRSVRGVAVPFRRARSDGHRGPRLQDRDRAAQQGVHQGPRRHLPGDR